MSGTFFRPNLKTTLILISISTFISTASFADGGIRVHRANQYENLKSESNENEHTANTQRENVRLLKLLQHQHLRHHKSSQSQQSKQAQTPDSRFPNSYRDLSYKQKLEAQKFKKP